MMTKSVYDEQFLTEEQQKQLEAFNAEWDRARAAGDQAAMEAARAAAEYVRAQAGYSGGDDGVGYVPLTKTGSESDSAGTTASKEYAPQTDLVNWAYDEALRAHLAALKNSYEQDAEAAQLTKEAIPGTYQDKRNDLAARSELAERNFSEYAAGTGLASGARGQARLAMENTRQAGLSDLGAQEAAALTQTESLQARLMRDYQNGIVQAVARGEYERAAALLEEYRRSTQPQETVSRTQADDYYSWRQQWEKEIDEAAERLRQVGQ